MRDGLTADQVRETVFSRPPLGRRGYDEDEVDALVELVVARLEGHGELTAADIHNVAFARPPIFKRSYNSDEVDAFLDVVEAAIAKLERSG
jgi:DivIVA domain-containing protein